MFKYLMVISSLFVLISMNPVQSLLWLIFVFVCGGIVLIEMGAEFIAILLIMVYVGAIAVLFLFVIMLLNIRLLELNFFYRNYWYLFIFFCIMFLFQLFFIIYERNSANIFLFNDNIINFFWLNNLDYLSNIEVIGFLFFSVYFHYFIILGLVLLLALLATIVLLI